MRNRTEATSSGDWPASRRLVPKLQQQKNQTCPPLSSSCQPHLQPTAQHRGGESRDETEEELNRLLLLVQTHGSDQNSAPSPDFPLVALPTRRLFVDIFFLLYFFFLPGFFYFSIARGLVFFFFSRSIRSAANVWNRLRRRKEKNGWN